MLFYLVNAFMLGHWFSFITLVQSMEYKYCLQLKCFSLFPREAALHFHKCIKDLNEIHTIILIPHLRLEDAHLSQWEPLLGLWLCLWKCKSLVTWCCHLMSRRKKGALHGLSYFPSLIRSSSNTQFRTFPTSIYFISTTSDAINVCFILHKRSFCPFQCLLPVVVADALNCGCKWWSVWLAVPDCCSLADCPLSHLYCSMHLMTTMA